MLLKLTVVFMPWFRISADTEAQEARYKSSDVWQHSQKKITSDASSVYYETICVQLLSATETVRGLEKGEVVEDDISAWLFTT